MSEAIIVFNAGSTSVKFGAYEVAGRGALTPISHGEVSDMQADPQFVAKNSAGKPLDAHEFGKGHADRPPHRAPFCRHLAREEHREHEGGCGRTSGRARRHKV